MRVLRSARAGDFIRRTLLRDSKNGAHLVFRLCVLEANRNYALLQWDKEYLPIMIYISNRTFHQAARLAPVFLLVATGLLSTALADGISGGHLGSSAVVIKKVALSLHVDSVSSYANAFPSATLTVTNLLPKPVFFMWDREQAQLSLQTDKTGSDKWQDVLPVQQLVVAQPSKPGEVIYQVNNVLNAMVVVIGRRQSTPLTVLLDQFPMTSLGFYRLTCNFDAHNAQFVPGGEGSYAVGSKFQLVGGPVTVVFRRKDDGQLVPVGAK
jgi:hypothetical protein